MPLVKACIRNLATGTAIQCMFNPTEYSFSKNVSWSVAQDRGANVPNLEFAGGEPATLTLKLFFDTSDSGEDVRKKYTNALWDLAMVVKDTKDPETKKGVPPYCTFEWGKAWSFQAVVTSISTNFTMFLEDGTPTRATVDLSLKQSKDEGKFPGQNPTSAGLAGHKRHIVQQDETLDLIAFREYGESRHWRHIADSNRLADPMRVRAGTMLQLPPLQEG